MSKNTIVSKGFGSLNLYSMQPEIPFLFSLLKSGQFVIINSKQDGMYVGKTISFADPALRFTRHQKKILFYQYRTFDIDQAVDNTTFTGYQLKNGEEMYGWVEDGADAITTGDYLEMDANGTLRKLTETEENTGFPFATALEDVDNSAGANSVQIKVEIF